MEGLGEMDPNITQRLTLLVYDDIGVVHDHLVTVFGFGPGRLSRDETGRVVSSFFIFVKPGVSVPGIAL